MNEVLRAAVIGSSSSGGWGHNIDELFIGVPGLRTVAVADDTDVGVGDAVTRHRLTQTAQGFLDWRKMLADVKPDVVAICSRNIQQHAEMAIVSAKAGVRGIFMEKPFVKSVSEADAVVSACEKSNTKLNLALVNRYCPTITAVWELIADGKLGTLLELRARGKEDVRGGGEDLWVLGPHVLDLMVHFGGAPQWCNATVLKTGVPVKPNDFIAGAEGLPMIAGDSINASFGLADGPTGFFASTREAGLKQPNFGLTLLGTKGEIHIRPDYIPQAYFRAAPAWRMNRPYPWIPIGDEGLAANLTDQGVDRSAERASWGRLAVTDLIDAIQTDREPETGMFTGLTLTEMNEAIYASSLTGQRLHWPLDRALLKRIVPSENS
ncbi:MAG: Gfo/Idh/MocA family oxidoreductase [Pirellulales bacterium]|nr:Gfo/Idh/MocA family oxidoreductase [Pirellulales bacterium]